MGQNYANKLIDISITTVPATVASAGIGGLCLLIPEGSSTIPQRWKKYSDLASATVDNASGILDAQSYTDVVAAMSESLSPTDVYVATYNPSTETPADAADIILLTASPPDIGVFVCCSRTDSDIAAMGTWLSAGSRKDDYAVIAQTSNTSIESATPSAVLDPCKVRNFRLIRATSTEPTAASAGAQLAGKDMSRGQAAAQISVTTPDFEHLISASEAGYITDNNASVLLPADVGSSIKIFSGVNDYDGAPYAMSKTLQYTKRRVREQVTGLAVSLAQMQRPIPFSSAGEQLLKSAVNAALGAIAPYHFTPGTVGAGPNAKTLESGYLIEMSKTSSPLKTITASVTLIIAGEAEKLSIPITGFEAS